MTFTKERFRVLTGLLTEQIEDSEFNDEFEAVAQRERDAQDELELSIEDNNGLTASGYYWYRGKWSPNEWTIVSYGPSRGKYSLEFVASDEIYTIEDSQPGEFVGPLKPPSS